MSINYTNAKVALSRARDFLSVSEDAQSHAKHHSEHMAELAVEHLVESAEAMDFCGELFRAVFQLTPENRANVLAVAKAALRGQEGK